MKRFLCFFLVLAALLSQAVPVRATDFVVRQRIVLPVVQVIPAPVYLQPLALASTCAHQAQAIYSQPVLAVHEVRRVVEVQRVERRPQIINQRQVIRTRTVIR